MYTPYPVPEDLGEIRRYLDDELRKVSDYSGDLEESVIGRLDDLDARLSVFENVELWHEVGEPDEPPFENGWANFDTTRKARFYKDPFGIVHLSGLVAGGTVGQVVFTLPAGYIPDYTDATGVDSIYPIVSNNAFGRVGIFYTGEVNVVVGDSIWASLDGISFRAA